MRRLLDFSSSVRVNVDTLLVLADASGSDSAQVADPLSAPTVTSAVAAASVAVLLLTLRSQSKASFPPNATYAATQRRPICNARIIYNASARAFCVACITSVCCVLFLRTPGPCVALRRVRWMDGNEA